jgi:cysteine desulfurase
MTTGCRVTAGNAPEPVAHDGTMKRIVPIYLDYNATSPVFPQVLEAMAQAQDPAIGNASSVHRYGQRARALVDDARTALAALLDADPDEVVFTSGGTEAINLSLRGAFDTVAPTGRKRLVVSAIEHEAVLNTARALAARGAEVVVVQSEADGVVRVRDMAAAITRDTALVSLMLANNEIGTIQPVAEVARLCRDIGVLFHTDAVQGPGKIPVSVRELEVDLLSISAHKFGGPKGVGALYVRRGTRLAAQATGGRQERNRRAGTENVPGLAGLGAAARLARESLAQAPSISERRDRLEHSILTTVAGTVVNGRQAQRVPNTTNISFEGVEAESLLIALDLEGVAVSTGSACSSGSLEPSHVLRGMGLPHTRARSSIRFSLGQRTTDREIDFVAARLPDLVAKLRRIGKPAEAVR